MIALPGWIRTTDSIADELGGVVTAVGPTPVIVTDSALLTAGVAPAVRAVLGCDVIAVPGGEPVSETVAVLARELADRRSSVVVAVGGGSVLDTAKLAAKLVADPGGLEQRLLGAAPFPPGVAVVAVPTTAGSGAEATRTAIVSHNGHKSWAWGEALRPDAAVLAPELTATLPRSIALAAGLDAFSHAVEAATGRRAVPEITHLGFEAAGIVHGRLPGVLANPADRPGRTALLQAAAAAGVAIDTCGTGIGHAVGHALASVGTIPHGVAVMLGLRAGLEWTLEAASPAYEGLAAALGGTDTAGLPALFDQLLDGVGYWTELSRWERPDPDLLATEMAAVDHRPMSLNNARPITPSDVPTVVDAVMRAWPA